MAETVAVPAGPPTPPAAGPPGRSRRKVLHVAVDGVNADDMLHHAATPHLDALAAGGVLAVTRPYGPEVTVIESAPGWATIMTGVWPDRHGIVDNTFAGGRLDRYPDWLTRLERVDPGFSTFAITDWGPLADPAGPGPLFSPAIDVNLGFEAFRHGGYALGDRTTTDIAAAWLRDQDSDAHVVYLGNVDIVGHLRGAGPGVPEYMAAIEAADMEVGELMAAVRSRPRYADEDWLILVSTDHGHAVPGGGHGDGLTAEECTTWLIAAGGDVPVGPLAADRTPQMVDAAVTALAHLGVAVDPAWGLDGRPIGAAGGDRRRPVRR